MLLDNVSSDLDKYSEGASYYFNAVRLSKYTTICLTGLSTIVLGIDFGDYENVSLLAGMKTTTFSKNVALIIGAVVTIVNSMMSYWNVEKYWLINKTIAHKMKVLRDDIESDILRSNLQTELVDHTKWNDEYKKNKSDFYKYWEGALVERDSTASDK